MSRPIFADFNNLDEDGYIRLNTAGTLEDIRAASIQLKDGLRLVVSDGDLTAEVLVREPGRERVWRAQIVSDPVDRSPWTEP
jgi:hypothetical protein